VPLLARTRFSFGFLVMLAAGAASGAEAPPPSLLTLAEAIRLGYEHSPSILRAREAVHLAEGQLRQAKGQFDTQLQFNSSLEQNETVVSSANAGQQNESRVGYDKLSEAFKFAQQQLQSAIDSGSTTLPVCPPELSNTTLEVNGIPVTICQKPKDFSTDISNLRDQALLYFSPSPALADLSQFQAEIAKILALDVQSFSSNLTQQGEERVRQNLALATQWANLATLDRERLGGMPTYQFARTSRLNFSLAKPLRSGTVLQITGGFQGVEQNFVGKLLDPAFGGEGVQTAFTSGLNFVLNQPLLRGRGRAATDAPELAARENLKGAQETYEHTVAAQAQAIANSYFNLVLAQQNVELLDDSVRNQERILEGMRALKKAGDISRSDVTRVEARLADAQTQAAGGRVSAVAARAALARDIGWSATETSLVAREVVAPPAEVPTEGLEASALRSRHDLAAARNSKEAARFLREAALANTKPVLNVSVSVGTGSAYYSPYFRALNDEFYLTHEPGLPLTNNLQGTAPPNAPLDTGDPRSPVNYYSPVGFWRALTRHPNPTVAVQFTLKLPFGNNTQRGQLAQAQAAFRTNEVMTSDLERVIVHNVHQVAAALRHKHEEVLRWQEASAQQEITWRATQDLRAAGEMSIIDVLLTEQDFTSTRLQLAQAEHDLATRIVQLRFETGNLVPFQDGAPGEANIKGLLITP
jgi:outer membrane protein TolC